MNKSSQIQSAAIISYITLVISILGGLFYTPWMVRQIGNSDYGLFILASSFLTYLLTDFGFSNTINRYINIYRAQDNEEKINNLISLSLKIYLWFDLAIFVLVIVVYFFIGDIFKGLTLQEIEKFKVIYLISGLFGILSFPFTSLNGIIMAYERFVWLKVIELISKVATILASVIALFLGYKLFSLVFIIALIGAIIIVIKLIYVYRIAKIKIDLKIKNKSLLSNILRFSVWIFLFLVAELLLLNFTPTILGVFSNSMEIAIFAIGVTLVGYVKNFANVLNGLFTPKVAQLIVKDNYDLKSLNLLMAKVGRIQLIIVGVFIISFITLGKQFITLWMGQDYIKSYYITILLIIPGFIYLTQEIGNTLLLVVDKMKYRSLISIITSIISLIISAIFASKYGSLGAAFGIFIAYVLGHVIAMNYVYWKVLKLDMKSFFIKCHLKLLIPLTLTFLAGFLINYIMPVNNVLNFSFKAGLFVFLYFIIMWTLGLNEEEKKLTKGILVKIPILKLN